MPTRRVEEDVYRLLRDVTISGSVEHLPSCLDVIMDLSWPPASLPGLSLNRTHDTPNTLEVEPVHNLF